MHVKITFGFYFSARSNDIIVRGSAAHEVLLEINRFVEVGELWICLLATGVIWWTHHFKRYLDVDHNLPIVSAGPIKGKKHR